MEDSDGLLGYSRDNVVTHPSLAAEIMMFKCRGAQQRIIMLDWTDIITTTNCFYLQHEDLSGRLVDIKLGLVRSVGVDALSGQEVDDVLRSVLVAVRGRHLGQYFSYKNRSVFCFSDKFTCFYSLS